MILEDQPGARRGDTDVRIARCRWTAAIGRPRAKQTEFLENLFDRSGIRHLRQSHQHYNSNNSNQAHTAETPTPDTITAARVAAIGRSAKMRRATQLLCCNVDDYLKVRLAAFATSAKVLMSSSIRFLKASPVGPPGLTAIFFKPS